MGTGIIKDFQAMSLGKAAFYGKDNRSGFIIDIIAVKPGEHTLFK